MLFLLISVSFSILYAKNQSSLLCSLAYDYRSRKYMHFRGLSMSSDSRPRLYVLDEGPLDIHLYYYPSTLEYVV